ncbi:tail protein [Ralstonia phage RSB3]|uniref:Putative tail tubular protein B n=1 Tax=Ralstonia phage RSB3 TaxID=1402875 RepID=U3TM41_9CAUD|nr:tail protein [Ralstonia phage RSB3]BAN92349.1 putative tail tubular protein B [Ralstonia phage RSB3]
MAAFEGSQKNMLQGVSQQLTRERLEGQVSAQENMLSDLVTGLRRRPGAEVKTSWVINTANRNQLVGWDSDVAGVRCRAVLNGVDGVLRLADQNWGIFATLQSNYLKFTDRKNIQFTVTDDKMYILNKALVPYVASTNGGGTPNNGFYFIKAGAFQTAYRVTVANASASVTAQYVTPAATATDAAAQSTPAYIAQQLINSLNAQTSGWGWGFAIDGAYVYCATAGSACSVTSNNSTSQIGTSGTSHVQSIADLPARLPGNGYIIAVGSSTTPTYYRWDSPSSTWKETAAANSPATLGNMPIYVQLTGGTTWSLGQSYEGRLAGDDLSNPSPSFLGYGIDGIGSFQGRLVLLAGSKVCMSASGKPYRFYRSSVDSVLSSDPIDVGASANSSASYEFCVPFNKDLLLFSEKYQALVPGGGTVVTPQNATVVVTSTYDADMSSRPLALGRTVMFPAPRSKDYFGMLEMLPSPYTDSQYVSSDVTAHLPKYMQGRCRFSVSSSVSGIACFASTIDFKTLIVHEYTWDGDTKAQQAWHKWTFPYDIADAFFSGSEIHLLFVNNGQMCACSVDPRIGTLTAAGDRRPFLDMYFPMTVANNAVSIPAFYQQFDPTFYTKVRISDVSAELFGEEVGVETRSTTSLVTVPSFGAGAVNLGIGYRSSISPSMPTVKDDKGVVLSSNKLTLLRFMIGTENSYEYEALVHDSGDDGADSDDELATLYWGAADLELGSPRIAIESTAILPCRTNAASTTVLLYTDSLGELNIVSLEYVCRYNQKLKRR